MSTSTSPQSDAAIALLWGDRWWITGRTEPLGFGAIAEAAAVLLQHFEEHGRPSRLRVLYQPAFLTSVAVECPHGNRATLQAALQEEHPLLAMANYAWGYEPIFGGNTLLHYETEPFLQLLAADLRAGGVVVEGAWPLASALNFVPTDWPDTGALTVVAVASGLAVIFRHTPAGMREVRSASGEPAAELVATTVQQAFERDDTALYIAAFDEAGQRLAAQVARLERAGRTDLGWESVARAAQTLSRSHPNQMLPQASRLGASPLVTGVTAIAFASSALLAVQIGLDVRADRRAADTAAVAVGRLQSEVEGLRRNQAEVTKLETEIAAAGLRRSHCALLLKTLSQALPRQVVMTSIRADQTGFTLSGGVSTAGLSGDDWRRWIDQFRTPALPWKLVAAEHAMPTADFSIKGVWL